MISKHLGKKYNFLFINNIIRKGERQYGICICDCGNEKEIILHNVCKGHTQSCGCKHGELISKKLSKPKTHGYGSTRIYHTWWSMLDRCNNNKNEAFIYYGKRGISVCSEWYEIENFVKWANNNGYHKTLTIDRINNDGNYEPSNCRWATRKVQANNKSTSIHIEHNGEKKTHAEWAEVLKGCKTLIRCRVQDYGWDEEKAVTTPPLKGKITDEQVREIYNLKKTGQMQTMALSKRYGISEDMIRCIMRGKKIKSAFL